MRDATLLAGKAGRSIRNSPEPPRAGDKVRMKAGSAIGLRGVVAAIRPQGIIIDLLNGSRATVTPSEVTNYSAAARLAWRTMPKRAGRPANRERKVRVSLRIDEATWRALAGLVQRGRIRSREHLLNELLKQAAKRLAGSSRLSVSKSKILQLGSHPGSERQ